MITVDTIMDTGPCVRWPRASVAAALARADRSSWVALVESARRDRWRTCSLDDMRWLLCQHAARHHRAVLTPWVVEVTHRRVAAQRRRWPQASAATVEIRDRLERWHGASAEIREICSAAASNAYVADAAADDNAYAAAACSAAAYAAFAAAYASYAYVAAAAAYAVADAASYASNAYVADAAAEQAADDAGEMLLDLARRLDQPAQSSSR